MKRWIAALLTIAMLMSCLPLNVLAESGGPQAAGYSAAAEEAQAQKATPEMDVETGGMTVEATNSFGQLLLDSMDETNGEAEAGQYDEGNKITGLTVEGAAAQVDFCTTAEAADLVVAIYDEDETEMLASGTVEVAAGQTNKTVALEGTMPAYFIAKAYLLAKEDHAPISPAFSTSLYTEEMTDLVNSTIDDYDESRVLNLDDDPTTNFIVVSRNTVLAEQENGQNIVVENDAEQMHYVIENADESIRNLQPGKMLVCSYGEDSMLIAKVAEIQVDGTTVTIAGENAEISEVFEQVKIQASGTTEDFTADMSTCSSELTYEGVTEESDLEDENNIVDNAYDILFEEKLQDKVSKTKTYKYSVGAGASAGGGEVTISGFLELKIGSEFAYLLSKEQQYVALTAAADFGGNINVTGSYKKSYQLGNYYYMPVVGVYVGVNPHVDISATAEIDYRFNAVVTMGMAYDTESGFKDISTGPEFTSKLTVAGVIEIGLDLNPYAQVGFRFGPGENQVIELIGVELTAMLGLEIDAELTGKNFEEFSTAGASKSNHACNTCLKAELYARVVVAAKMRLLKDLGSGGLELEQPIIDIKNKVNDYYYSFDYGDSGFTTCPHIEIDDGGGTGSGGDTGDTGTGGGNKIELDPNSIIASGTCGKQGSNLTWVLDDWGTMVISGNGEMGDYSIDRMPWYPYYVRQVIITEGVTTIGDYAFSHYDEMTDIEIPQTVVSIGKSAFLCCTGLASVTLPPALKRIGESAFKSCHGLTSIVIPNGVTSIENYAFFYLRNLENIVLPESITKIGSYVFGDCVSLANITIPQSVTSIEEGAFFGCNQLTEVVLPPEITSISDYAFSECTNLRRVVIPEGVTNIGNSSFSFCKNLTDIALPNNLMTIGDNAFASCSSLENITLPESLQSIDFGAFGYCSNLLSVEIPNNVTNMGDYVFWNCSNLSKVVLPQSITGINELEFQNCVSLTQITFTDYVTSIGESAFEGCNNLKDIFYSGDEDQWKDIAVGAYNEELTNATVHYNSAGSNDANSLTNGIFTGSAVEETTGWQASFENLIPNTDYAIIVSLSSEDPLAAGKLQYITQVTADENGTLTVYYRQSDPEAAAYVVACGSGKASPAEPTEPSKPEEPSTPSTPGTDPGSSGSGSSSGGGSGDSGAAAALLLAGAGAVAAVVVARAVLPVEVSGIVTDETGTPLPGATVAFWQNGAVVQQTVTGENGGYSVQLKKGGYDLAVSYLDPATGTAFQQTVTITAPDKARTVALDLSALKVPAGQA